MDWRTLKGVVFASDDWGMHAWAPDMAAFRAIEPLGFFTPVWSYGTLETPAEMQRLFDVLLAHRGADERPVVFTPYYLAANPDFEAIQANGFERYVDRALDGEPQPRWERGPYVAKALEGRALGVWDPEYHARSHHFSGERWVRRLREGEQRALTAWRHNMYVCETPLERLGQYEDMTPEQIHEFVEGGFEMFRRTFGYRPVVALTCDWVPGSVKILADHGARAVELVENADREGIAGTDLLEMPIRNTCFEPLGLPDDEVVGCVDKALGGIQKAWAANLPAAVSSHRTNYVSLDTKTIDRNFALLKEMLARLLRDHPDFVFLSAWEAAQLHARGVSSIRYGEQIIVRNHGGRAARVAVELREGDTVDSARNLRTGGDLPCGDRPEAVEVGEGDYLLQLACQGT